MDSTAFLAHILSQTRQNIQFLIAQNQIPENDGHVILAKLPAPIQASTQPSVQALAQQTQNLSINPGAHNFSASQMPQPNPSSVPYRPPASQPVLFQGRAIWNYNELDQNPNDLSFHAGDIIDIIAETNQDWWTGSHRGKQGLFPSNYIERLPSSAPAPVLPSPAATPYSEKFSYPEQAKPGAGVPPSYQQPGGYQPPPPGGPYSPYGDPTQLASNPAVANPEPPKKGKFGKLGNTLAHSAVGGAGFGAGSAVAGGIIHSIF